MKRIKRKNPLITVKTFLKTGLVNLVLSFLAIVSITTVYSFFNKSLVTNTQEKIEVVKMEQDLKKGQKLDSDLVSAQFIERDKFTDNMISANIINDLSDYKVSQDKHAGEFLYNDDIITLAKKVDNLEKKLQEGLHLVYLKSADLYLPFPDLVEGDVISLYAHDPNSKTTVILADDKVIQIIRQYEIEGLSETETQAMYGLIFDEEEVLTLTKALGNSWFIQIVKNKS